MDQVTTGQQQIEMFWNLRKFLKNGRHFKVEFRFEHTLLCTDQVITTGKQQIEMFWHFKKNSQKFKISESISEANQITKSRKLW